MTELNDTEKALFGLAILLVLITAVFVNSLVCFVVYRNRLLRQQFSSVFIVNLALCDFLMALLAMPFSLGAVVVSKWPFGAIMCHLTGFVDQILSISAILTLATISVDRFYAVIKPLQYRAKMTMQKALRSIVYVWVQAFVFAVVPAVSRWYVFNEYYCFCTFASFFRTRVENAFVSCLYLANFALPLVVMLAAYYKIFKVARRHSQRQIAPAVFTLGTFGIVKFEVMRQEIGRLREAKAARKILIVIAAFLCCNAPYTLMRMLELTTGRALATPRAVTIGAKWINFLKSVLNPVIYGLLQRRFRAALASVFRWRLRGAEKQWCRTTMSFLHFSPQNGRRTGRPRARSALTAETTRRPQPKLETRAAVKKFGSLSQ